LTSGWSPGHRDRRRQRVGEGTPTRHRLAQLAERQQQSLVAALVAGAELRHPLGEIADSGRRARRPRLATACSAAGSGAAASGFASSAAMRSASFAASAA